MAGAAFPARAFSSSRNSMHAPRLAWSRLEGLAGTGTAISTLSECVLRRSNPRGIRRPHIGVLHAMGPVLRRGEASSPAPRQSPAAHHPIDVISGRWTMRPGHSTYSSRAHSSRRRRKTCCPSHQRRLWPLGSYRRCPCGTRRPALQRAQSDGAIRQNSISRRLASPETRLASTAAECPHS